MTMLRPLRPLTVRLAALAVAALVVSGCGVNPVTGERELRLISEREEIAIGEQHYEATQQSQGGAYTTHPELVEYVRRVGHAVAEVSDRPELPYEFTVINDSTPNAWALPGGKIGINRGLLVEFENEAQLAAVLGHEVVHAAARHGAQRVERGLMLQVGVMGVGVAARDHDYGGLMVLGAGVGAALIAQRYSRSAESEADYFGTRYMARAGYDPEGAVELMEKFVALSDRGEPGWLEGLFASHPPSTERVEANRETAAAIRAEEPDREFRMGREEYLAAIRPLKEAGEAYAAHDEGRRALRDGDHRQALRLANKALEIEPRESRFHGLKADALAEKGRHEAAVAAYDEAIARDDGFFLFHLHRGLVKQQLGDDEAARADIEAANERLPTSLGYLALGQIAKARGDRDAARDYLRIAAEDRGSIGDDARKALRDL